MRGRTNEVIRVRMGLHTGEPTPTADGYVGLDMHRAARVTAAAHGGQVLLSQTTRDLLPENLDGLTFRDLGDHRLKDLTGPQRLHQLCIEGLAVDFPPPRTIEGRVTNLPAQPTPLVGREAELEAVRTLLLDENTRMVTLTGPGGTGKTRLALQVAADLVGEFPDGVYGVLLAPISDPELVPLELARVLGVEESSSLSLVEALKAELRNRRVLIVFDNFEHVGAAAELLAVLLGACQRLKMLVTSREPLRIAAERQYPVPPLGDSEAVLLFVRARPRRAPGLRADDATRADRRRDLRAPRRAAARHRARGGLDEGPPARFFASPARESVGAPCRERARSPRATKHPAPGDRLELRPARTTTSAAFMPACRCSWADSPSRRPSA